MCGLVVSVGSCQRTVNPSFREFDSHPSLIFGLITQLAEYPAFNRKVEGSIPSESTKIINTDYDN